MFYSERSQGSPQAVRLCRLQNRSLLSVNEDFEGKRNTEIYFLVTPLLSGVIKVFLNHYFDSSSMRTIGLFASSRIDSSSSTAGHSYLRVL